MADKQELPDYSTVASLTNSQLEQQDMVDNACFNLLQEIARNMGLPDLQWDMEHISTVREAVEVVLVDKLKLCTGMELYPYIFVGNYCAKCGQAFAAHNADGSCVQDEPESQESKHADAGYMNDVRFGETLDETGE